ncbi:FxLYD domain-containing protein [Halovivax cerinus]|uniref:FxLYD domain-containing protein n=2 Tax=Halovivax cerinus TaxID=1487865 RepID=A0ABD5NJ18_9EURY
MSTEESWRPGRRRWLSAVGGSVVGAALAGCLGTGGPAYESGSIPAVNGSTRTARQQAAAATGAITSTADGVSPLESLSLTDHSFVYEGGYQGATVQGTARNGGDRPVQLVEVRTRVYDDAGAQLGQYMARTGDLAGDTSWSFTVIVLERPSTLARYDITVLGVPG